MFKSILDEYQLVLGDFFGFTVEIGIASPVVLTYLLLPVGLDWQFLTEVDIPVIVIVILTHCIVVFDLLLIVGVAL